MSYFPARVEGDPPQVADSWSETLTPTEGQWMLVYVGGYLRLVNSPVICRLACINFGMDGWEEQLGLLFKFNQPQNLTQWKSLRFSIRADKQGGDFNGNLSIWLLKGENWIAGKAFGVVVNTGAFEQKEFIIDPAQWDWVDDADWTAIDGFMIYTDDYTRTGMGPFSIYIDEGPFFYAELARLTITSSPTGKKFTASLTPDGGTVYSTPRTLEVTLGAAVYINLVDVEDFIQWEDGNTNPNRTVIVDTLFKTIKATYEVVEAVTIIINSNPRGKKFSVNGTEYVTPQGFSGAVGATMTVTLVDTEGFRSWSDGDTNITKTFTFTENVTVTANYEGAGVDLLPWIVLATFVSIDLFVVYAQIK